MSRRKQQRNRRAGGVAEPRSEHSSDQRPFRGARGNKGADTSGHIWLFGTHAVTAAIANPKRAVRRLLCTQDTRPHLEDLLIDAKGQDINRPAPSIVDRYELNQRLPEGAVHQGLAAEVTPLEDIFIEDILLILKDRPRALIVVIDQGTDPRNVGAVLRSAAAFGAAAVVVQDRHAPGTTGHLAKAASGALETVPLVRVINLNRALDTLKQAEFWCVGLDGTAAQSTMELEWPSRTVLVVGSEGTGMRRLTREACDFLVKIPMTGQMESLNLSNATAIALYEIFRNAG